MKQVFAALTLAMLSSRAFALNVAAPEIDGALTLQIIALVGGLALVVRKARK